MVILFLKSLQPGLFDKLVPVAASVSKQGVVRKPHVAIRHVRPTQPQPKPVAHHVDDLFAHAERKAPTPPPPKSRTAESFDLFAEHAAPTAPKPEPPPRAPTPGAEPTPKPAPQALDYSGPFDPAAAPAFGVPAGTSKEERRVINAQAVKFLDEGTTTGQVARDTFRAYSGNGGCGDSLNEFYTDPKVAAAMWYALRNLGVGAGATVLEPSCATGVFLETAPSGVKVTGVEMDPVAARIGEILHPGHEVRNASLERFATQDTRQFDAVVGNAPFGLRGSLIKDDKPSMKTAEAYFMDTALDKTRPGGVVAMIVPTGLLDSKRDRSVRQRLLCKGMFLGALRMPNTAFEHSHTGVTTDVVFFRKRPDDVAGALLVSSQDALKALGVWDEEFLAGDYFTSDRGEKNVLGVMTEGWRAKAGMGDDITVEGSMVGVPEEISRFQPGAGTAPDMTVAAILAAAPDDRAREVIRGAAIRRPYESGKRGDVKVIDGVEYVLEGDPLRWHRVDEFMALEAVTVGQNLAAAIESRMNGDVQGGIEERVRAYVEKYGVPSKNANLILAAHSDKVLYRLIGAVKPDGSLSDVVTGKAVAAMESSFDAAAESLALEAGWFKPEQVAARWHGGDSEAVLDQLYASLDYALDPVSALWTSKDQYLSGELWPKLDEAKAAMAGGDLKPEDRAKLERQVASLEETIDPKSLEDVEIALNSAFLPLNVVAAFFNKDREGRQPGAYDPGPMVITFDHGVYAVKGGPWGSSLLEKYLNRTGVKKDDEWPTVERWNREFKDWLCASPYRDEVEDLYNRKFRGYRQRAYSETPFEIPGLNPEGLKPHIYSGIRFALEAGKGILADDVGLGKTVQGLILARMAKVTGAARRPMIVVPKQVLANWAAEAEKWFPGSKVLVIGESFSRDKDGKLKGKSESAAERNRKLHDLTQNDYDFILVSQPAWNDLDLDPVTKGKYLEDDFWVQRGDALGNAGDKRTNKIREAYQQAMAGREFQKRTDAIYFNDLGVDMLIGDEMHAFKNLFAAKNRFGQTPKFLGGSGLSNRALDMQFKARWVREHNDGRNVFGLTATPTKNSPLEIYSMLSHMAPEAFERIGVRNSEEFLDRFCEFRDENILNTRGEIENALVTVGFKNLDELREIMRRFINRRTAEDVGLQLPTRDDRQHLVEMTPEQHAVYADLREQAAKAAGARDATGEMHIFSIMDRMAKAAMDLEMYDAETYAGAVSPKYDAAAEQIAEGAKDGGQVVFADSIAVHGKMLEALVKRGIPREQIAIINAQVAASAAQRQNICDDFNAGKLRVVIGNTATMGEGMNMQRGTTDIHHMDLPWEPASMQQRNGRGLRQGNLKEAVRIHTYIAKGSFDGYRYQCMSAKKDWQDLLWNGGDRVENLAREGTLSRDDMMVMLSADPERAREDLAKNKAAAEERFTAMKHSEAAADFGRYQEMKRSFVALKNKETPAAQRLRVRLERLRHGLEENAHFRDKTALDSKEPVLIHPNSGEALRPGVAFEVPAADGAPGERFVVTAALPQVSTVKVRFYGQGVAREMSFPLDKIPHIKPFEYDEAAERKDIEAHLTAAAASKVNAIGALTDLHEMPSSLLQSSYGTIQRQLKEGIKNHTIHMPYGGSGWVKDGAAVLGQSYGHAEKLADHDVMIPTEEHRRLAMDAYARAEAGKTFGWEHSTSRSRHVPDKRFVTKYPGAGYGSETSNSWGSVGEAHFGPKFKEQAQHAFERIQAEKARHAPSLTQTISDLAATVPSHYGTPLGFPRKALAVMWAKAKHTGKLDSTMAAELPPGRNLGDVFVRPDPRSNYNPGIGSKKVRDVLFDAARVAHPDLAAAMAISGSSEPAETVKKLLGLPVSNPAVVSGLRHMIAKHPDLAGAPVREFHSLEKTQANPQLMGASQMQTLGDLVEDLESDGDQRDAA